MEVGRGRKAEWKPGTIGVGVVRKVGKKRAGSGSSKGWEVGEK